MSMNKKSMAGTALAISLVGAGFTAPFSMTSFWGGLINNGFLAASIGGLADWFAVTALFRKPLGISYRTQILTRNRERIMQAVVDFAGNDLLSVDNIMNFVNQRDLSKMLVLYLAGADRSKVLNSIEKALAETMDTVDAEAVSKKASEIIFQILRDERTLQHSTRIIKEMANPRVAEALLPFLIRIVRRLLEDEAISAIIQKHVGEILKNYEGNGAGRAFVIAMAGLDSTLLCRMLTNKVKDYLDKLEDYELAKNLQDIESKAEQEEINKRLSLHKEAVDYITGYLDKLCDSGIFVERLQNLLISSLSAEKLEVLIKEEIEIQLSQKRDYWLDYVKRIIAQSFDDFADNEEWQKKVDIYMKDWLKNQLNTHHDFITSLIEERLAKLTDEELVEFIEPRVSDDLQMIRINGSVVGGLAGMLLYIFAFIVGQVLAK